MNDRLSRAGVRFLPWKGRSYETGINGKRLLILGDSHYFNTPGEVKGEDTTRRLVKECIEGDGHPFFWRIHELVASVMPKRAGSSPTVQQTYNSIAFYNYLVTSKLEHGSGGQKAAMYHASEEAMIAVIAELKPSHILILGQKTWNNFLVKTAKQSDKLQHSRETQKWNAPPSLSELWRYTLSDNHFVAATVYHPSARGSYAFSVKKPEAARVLTNFLKVSK